MIPIRYGSLPEGSYWGDESSFFGIARTDRPMENSAFDEMDAKPAPDTNPKRSTTPLGL